MWSTDTYPKVAKLEVTLSELANYGPTAAFIRECKRVFPNHIYKPNVRYLTLRLFDPETVELKATYRMPEIARTLFSRTYRPHAVTLFLGRIELR